MSKPYDALAAILEVAEDAKVSDQQARVRITKAAKAAMKGRKS